MPQSPQSHTHPAFAVMHGSGAPAAAAAERRAALLERSRIALGDIAMITGAVDGAIATVTPAGLQIGTPLASLLVAGELEGDAGVLPTVSKDDVCWLQGEGAAAICTDPAIELLAVPIFGADEPALAVLAYRERPEFSLDDRRFLLRTFAARPTLRPAA